MNVSLQEGTTTVRLPDPYHCYPGQMFTVTYKKAGQITGTATYVCEAYLGEDGELFHRWVQR